MTDSADPSGETVAADQSDVYLSQLPEPDRAIFLLSSGAPDLEAEIRLLRTFIARLLENVPGNQRHAAVLFGALCRAIGLQIKTRPGRDEVEEALLQASEEALRDLERAAGGEPTP